MEYLKNFFKNKNIDFFFPVAFILTIVPLIVRLTVVNLDLDEDTINLFGSAPKTDLFSQRKELFLIIFCVILIVFSLVYYKKIFRRTDKITNSIIISGSIFLFFTLLSAIFSQHKQAAFWGVYDRAEGFITITCYIIIFIYSIYTFRSTNDYKYVVIPILIVVGINSFLGLFQYVGQDLIKTPIGRLIALPSDKVNGSLSLLYEAGKLYGTLFHYNYVGSLVAIVLPILFCLMIFEDEDIMYKIILGIGAMLSLWLLFGSTSRAGIIGVSASTIFAVIIFWKKIILKWKPLLILFISIIVIAIGLNFATKGAIFQRVPSLITDTLSVFKDTSDFDYRDHTPIRDIQYEDKTVNLILPNETLKISYENNNFVYRNSKNEVIQYTKSAKDYITANKTFKNIALRLGKATTKSTRIDGLLVVVDNKPTFMFSLKDDNSIHLINLNSAKDIELQNPETFGFKGKEKLGSARGYIWSRSIPLIKNNLIIGSGPDTFIYQFPQNDLIAKYYAYDTPNTIVDKPHNLYLQIALNNGLIALLAFLVIMVIYITDSMKLYALKKDFYKSQLLGAATCLGVIGYLFAGIFNDSVISVAPIFWVVLGVGVALNFMNRTELKEKLMK